MKLDLRRRLGARLFILSVCCCSLAACSRQEAPVTDAAPTESAPPTTALVDAERIINADAEPGNWLSNGRTYSEQRYSPLDQIDEATVGDLGLAWYLDLDTNRGQQASPIVVDGVM
jgi:glucose dehydrogenase